MRRHDELALGAVTQLDDRSDDLGDDVAGLAQDDGVADQDALAPDLERIVQRGHLDGGPGDDDGFHHPERGHPPRAPDVDLDVEQPRVDLLGGVFERDGPTRRPRRRAQLALDAHLVDLDDDAVQLVLHRVPVLPVVGDVCRHLLDRVDDPGVLRGGQPPRLERGIRLALAGDVEPDPRPDAVHKHPQRAGGGDPRVLHPQRPRGGVAGVGERRPACGDEPGVELGEGRHREEHLAAHLDLRGHAVAGQPVRYAVDRAHVVGDVLPGAPVPPGQRPREAAVLVEQVDRETVDLELGEEVEAGAGVAGHPLGPGGELLVGEGVVKAEHPLQVVDRGEVGRERGAAHLLRRAVRGAQRGVRLLERREVAHQLVVVAVADRRPVLHVVGELVAARLLGQVRPLVEDLRGHPRPRLDGQARLGRGPGAGGAGGAGGAACLRHPLILPHHPDSPTDLPARRGEIWCSPPAG